MDLVCIRTCMGLMPCGFAMVEVKDAAVSPAGASVVAASSPSGMPSEPLKVSSPGTLVIRIVEASGLKLPEGTQLPERIERALKNDVSAASSVASNAGLGNKAQNRISVYRKQKWWLPCQSMAAELSYRPPSES